MKRLLILLAALLPFNFLRIRVYWLLGGYDISSDSRIGMFNIIQCDRLRMMSARIGSFNKLTANELNMASGSSIGRGNRINDANRVVLDEKAVMVSQNRIVGTKPGLSPFKESENIR